MMHKRLLGWLATALFLIVPFAYMPVAAANASYMATVPVNSQTDVDRLPALRIALSQVVNQVSNNRTMANQLKIDKLADLYPYIQRYYYKKSWDNSDSNDDSSDDSDSSDDDDSSSAPTLTQSLVVEFDPVAVDSLIKSANAATVANVNTNLTHVLLWLSVNENGKPYIVSNDDEDRLAQQVKFMGRTKNMDMMLPMLDLDDLGTVTPNDVTNFNVSAISQASVRYGSDLILVGTLNLENKKWNSHWMLLKNGKRFSWKDEGTTKDGIILSGIMKASEMITTPSAIEMNNEQRLILTITDIGNVTAYASVNAYLQQLNEVSSLQVLRVEPTRVVFEVALTNNDKEAFMKAVQANSHFVLQPSASPQELNYKWKAN